MRISNGRLESNAGHLDVIRGNGILLLAALFISFSVLGQDAILKTSISMGIEWSEGSIMLNNGKELKGLLKYNDKIGLLTYENGSDSRSFIARSVAGFEFFDERMQRQRVFYALLYEDSQYNIKKPLFFEVIFQFESFAVLSKVDPLDIERKTTTAPGTFNPNNHLVNPGFEIGNAVEFSQTETIYIMDTEASIKPFLKITETEVDGIWFDRSKTKNKLIDDDLIERHVGTQMFKKLQSFSKEHQLSFKHKSDLIKILEYYSSLVEFEKG